jgi:hypothetical protein
MTQQPNERLLPVIDECEHHHKFAKLPGHPMRDGLARCPHCMAQGLDAARVPAVQDEGMVDFVQQHIANAETRPPGGARELVSKQTIRQVIQAMSLYGETTSSESSS